MAKTKTVVIFSIIFFGVLGFAKVAEATIWFEYDNEDGVVGNHLPSSVHGPYYFEYPSNPPGYYRNDSIRSKYAEVIYEYGMGFYYIQIWNPDGTYGTAFGEYPEIPITLVEGTTYYLGGFFRFEKVDGGDVWDNGNDFDKLCGVWGGGFRWIIASGYSPYAVPYTADKYSFSAGVAKSAVPDWPYADRLMPNVSPYDSSNLPSCDYSRWYAVVMGVTAYANSNGRVRLWINGNLTTDYSGQTMQSGAYIHKFEMGGTVGQPGYDAPDHKRQFDGIILTDNWQDIVDGGYLQEPGIPPDTTPPSPPTGVVVN